MSTHDQLIMVERNLKEYKQFLEVSIKVHKGLLHEGVDETTKTYIKGKIKMCEDSLHQLKQIFE